MPTFKACLLLDLEKLLLCQPSFKLSLLVFVTPQLKAGKAVMSVFIHPDPDVRFYQFLAGVWHISAQIVHLYGYPES